jgi:hypothetical protein
MAKDGIKVHIYGDYDDRDIRKLQNDLEKLKTNSGATQKAMFGMSGAFKALAVAGAAIGIGLLTRGIGDMIAAAEESAKVQATTAQIIESTGGAAKVTAEQVGELSRRLSEQTAIDDELIQSSANLLLTFKNVQNVGEGVNAMFDRATLAAQDLAAAGFGDASSAAKMLGKALNDPIKGMTALGKAGVTFTEGQKDQIRALAASNDMLGAQKLIMAEVESQVGGVATATATATGRLKVMMGNMQEDIGGALLPFVGALAEGLGPALRELTPAFTSIAGSVGGLFTGALKIVLPALVGVVSVVADLTAAILSCTPAVVGLTAVITAYSAAIVYNRTVLITASLATKGFAATFPFLTGAIATTTTVLTGFRIALALALGPLGLIVLAIGALTGAALMAESAMKDNTEATKENAAAHKAAKAVIEGTKSGYGDVKDILGVLSGTQERTTATTEELARSTAYAEQLYSGYTKIAELAADRTEEIAKQAEAATTALNKSASAALSAAEAYALFSMTGYSPDPARDERNAQARATALFNASTEALKLLRDNAKKIGGGAGDAAADAIKSKADKFKEAGQTVVDALIAGFAAGETVVLGAVGTLMSKAVKKAGQYGAGFEDAMSSVTDAIGKKLVDALTIAKDGLQKAQDEADSWSASMASTLASAFDISGVFKQSLDENGKLTVSKYQDGVNAALAQFEWYTNVLTAVKNAKGSDALLQYLVSLGITEGATQGQAFIEQGLIPEMSSKLDAVAAMSKTVADAMLPAQLQGGIDSALQTYEGLKKAIGKDGPVYNAIQKLMDRLAASMSREATVTVTTINRAVSEIVKASPLPARANGGPVSSNTAYLVGERGPEVFVPSASGQIVPNIGTSSSVSAGVPASAGNTYNISVQAGVGDPRVIGQQIVEYVRKYENASGKVFAAA